jgi:copper homeostasis protein
MISLEVCANSLTSALAAQDGGAARVELCDNLNEGGTTPSYGQILIARKRLKIKLHTLIRPREGDFLYSDLEFEIMKADIQFCTQVGCDGIVIGILKHDGSIDIERCTELLLMAKQSHLSVTFHRAFDMCADLEQAMEDIIGMGFDRILTSGGKSTAIEGANIITHLIKKAKGRIVIMPGGGINEANAADLIQFTKATEIHSSARITVKSKMQFQNDRIILGSNYIDEFNLEVTDAQKVKEIIKNANG